MLLTETTLAILSKKRLIQGVRCLQNVSILGGLKLDWASRETPGIMLYNSSAKEIASSAKIRRLGNQESLPEL